MRVAVARGGHRRKLPDADTTELSTLEQTS